MFGRLTPTVKYILIANVGIFVLQSLLNLPLSSWLGLRVVFSDQFALHQFITYMWIHANFSHLLGNMFAVFVFGPLLEQTFGQKKFLSFYLACGIGAGMLFGGANFMEQYQLKADTETYLANPNPDDFSLFISEHKSRRFNLQGLAELSDGFYDNPQDPDYIKQTMSAVTQIFNLKTNIPMVGASGAVYGILMAFAMLFPNLQLMLLFPPIPIRAKYLVFIYGAIELYSELNRSEGDNVAHLAHLSGMLIAFILIRIWINNKTIKPY